MVKIGEIAERVGVNPKTIRFYESVGVMPEPPRTPAGYRDYEEQDVTRLSSSGRRNMSASSSKR